MPKLHKTDRGMVWVFCAVVIYAALKIFKKELSTNIRSYIAPKFFRFLTNH